MRIAVVDWFDSWFAEDTGRLENHDMTPNENSTVGWVVSEGDDYICLAQDQLEHGRFRHWFFIPKANIRSIGYLVAQERLLDHAL